MSAAFQSDAFQSNAWQIVAGAAGSVVVVPDVVGQTEEDGTAVLEAALFVVVVETARSQGVPAGVIISQSPVGGSSALEGATVTIVVSLGDSGGGGGKKKHRFALYIKGQRILGTKEDFQALLPKISVPTAEIQVMSAVPRVRISDDFEEQAKALENELKQAIQMIRDQEDEDILKFL